MDSFINNLNDENREGLSHLAISKAVLKRFLNGPNSLYKLDITSSQYKLSKITVNSSCFTEKDYYSADNGKFFNLKYEKYIGILIKQLERDSKLLPVIKVKFNFDLHDALFIILLRTKWFFEKILKNTGLFHPSNLNQDSMITLIRKSYKSYKDLLMPFISIKSVYVIINTSQDKFINSSEGLQIKSSNVDTQVSWPISNSMIIFLRLHRFNLDYKKKIELITINRLSKIEEINRINDYIMDFEETANNSVDFNVKGFLFGDKKQLLKLYDKKK